MELPVLVYDGHCGFCRKWVRRFRRIAGTRVHTIAWQESDLVRLGLTVEQCSVAVQFVDVDGTTSSGAAAVSGALRRCGRLWWVVGRLMAFPGVRVVCDRAYRWVAANRHRFRGEP